MTTEPPIEPTGQPPEPDPDTATARVPWESQAPTPPAPDPVPPTNAGWAAIPPAAGAPPPLSPVDPATPVQDPGAPGPAPAVLWAQPSSTVNQREVPGAPGLSFADTASRFIGWLIDSFIVGILGSIVAAALGFGRTTVVQNGSSVSANTVVAGAAFAVPFALIGLVYFVFFWTGGRRATPGQQLFHLQVGNAFDGAGLTVTQAIKRWLAYGTWIGLFVIVWSGATLIEFIWAIALLVTTVRSSTKQGLHDRFANSAVVRPTNESSSSLAKGCLILIVVIVGLSVVALVALILLGSQVSSILREVGESV